MDAAPKDVFDTTINFNLFTDNFELFPTNDDEESEIGIPRDICNLLDSIQEGNAQQNEIASKDFEKQNLGMRFKTVTEKDLDELQAENNAQSTH